MSKRRRQVIGRGGRERNSLFPLPIFVCVHWFRFEYASDEAACCGRQDVARQKSQTIVTPSRHGSAATCSICPNLLCGNHANK